MNRWDGHRSRRPMRSRATETVITTALVSLVVITFSLLLIHTLAGA